MSAARFRAAFSLACVTLMGACGPDGSPVEEHESVSSAAVIGTPDARQIAARLTRAVDLMSTSTGGTRYCTLAAGPVKAARYENGKYRVYLPGNRRCSSATDSFRGWVPADAVVIEDTAYFGKLQRIAPDASIDVEMSYAGDRIFCTGDRCLIDAPLYGMNRCYVHPRMGERVRAAAAALAERSPGAKLVMLDCYRPVYVQYRMAQLVNDPVWVAQPRPPRYGAHNGGIAVDVTIRDAAGQLVDMGSGFDEFTEKSHYHAPGLSPEQRENRKLLRDAMIAGGLHPYDAEWWHFSLAIDAEPLDLAL